MPATAIEGDTRTEGLRDVYTVSRLNREARGLLEAGLPSLWITGELSNFSRPASGHWYFTLKDADAQVRCAMFRQRNLMARVQPRDGMQVLLRARVGLYEARGDFQLVAHGVTAELDDDRLLVIAQHVWQGLREDACLDVGRDFGLFGDRLGSVVLRHDGRFPHYSKDLTGRHFLGWTPRKHLYAPR